MCACLLFCDSVYACRGQSMHGAAVPAESQMIYSGNCRSTVGVAGGSNIHLEWSIGTRVLLKAVGVTEPGKGEPLEILIKVVNDWSGDLGKYNGRLLCVGTCEVVSH